MPGAQCDYDVFTVAMNTATGTQDLVGDCGGKTPKGYIVLATRGTTMDTSVAGAMISIGAGDASGNVRLTSCMIEHGALIAAANSGRRQNNANLIQVLTTGDETVDGEAAFSSVSADTLTINITDAPTTAVQLEVWLFYGDTLLAHVDQIATSAIEDVSVTETGVPFRPRALIAFGATGAPSSATSARFAFGVCAFNADGTVQGQCGMPFFDRNLPTLRTACGGGFRSDTMLQRIIVDGTGVLTEEGRYEVVGSTADGFTITTRGSATAGLTIGYLALYTGNLRAWAGQVSIGTNSTGNKSITDPGFRPRFLACLGSKQATVNTYVSDAAQTIHYGIGAAANGGSACANVHAVDNATPNSDTRSLSSSKLMEIMDGNVASPTMDWDATLVSFDSTGFTVNVGTASSADRLVGFLALEAGVSLGWMDARSGHRWRRQLARM